MNNLPRWLPTGTPAILAGLLTSGVAYGLHALGIQVGPNEVANAVVPLAGFLVTAIVQKPTLTQVESEAKALEESTLGKMVGKAIEKRLDTLPQLEQELVKSAISVLNAPIVNAPPVIPPRVAGAIAQAVAENETLVEPGVPGYDARTGRPNQTFLAPASTEAPHITQ